jgi:hypothetical protein
MSGLSGIVHEVHRSGPTSSLAVMIAVLEADAIGVFDRPCCLAVLYTAQSLVVDVQVTVGGASKLC